MARTPVLIAGAGPTGLVLALSLTRRGVPFRIIDAGEGPGEHSRAMVVHARTLEFYRQFGFADELVDHGVKINAAHLRHGGKDGGRELVAVHFNDIGKGLSPYPFPLAYPQDDHERLLVEKLTDAGGRIEWQTRLVDFGETAQGVVARIERDGHTQEVEADYVCGCDGAHSAVRQTLQLGFPGGTYPQRYYVADVKIEGGFRRDLYINLGERTFALLLPVRSTGMQRLIGVVPPELADTEELGYEDLRPHVEPLIDAHATEVNWFAVYRVHHRVAERFRVGRAFILGDAGHIHSPAGGQGMNTGIGDAINLGWKLTMVLQGRAPDSLLDTYETERIEFARKLVATTDRAFTPIVAGGLKGQFVRRIMMPLLFTLGTRFEIGRRALFRLVSQIEIEYENSELSEGKAGEVTSGDRLPWVDGERGDNFAPLAALDWQAHVYGEAGTDLQRACEALSLPLHTFVWSEAAQQAGMTKNAFYLVRPDGYVAFVSAEQDVNAITAYPRSHGLTFA